MTGCPAYFFISDIAKQYWCHFESVIRCRDNEELAREQVEGIRKRSQGENYHDLPVVERSFFVIPKSKSLVPLSGHKTAVPAGDDYEKIYDISTGETLIFFGLDPELFIKHFGEFKGPVKITYSDWRSLSGKRYHQFERGSQGEGEEDFSEKYPTVSAFWEWEGRFITGTPDGLAEDFVYQFTSVGNYYVLKFVKPFVLAEAELYALFLRRPRVRVQIRVRQVNKIETFEQMSNNDKAIKLLAMMKELLEGKVPPIPPDVNWKCKNCSFRQKCQRVTPA